MQGTLLNNRYQLDQLLSRSDSGQLYLATAKATGEMLAVKLFSSPASLHHEAGLRFKRLCDRLERISHPHLIAPLETSQWEETVYQASPYFPGVSLEQALAESPLALKEGVQLIFQLAQALDAIHRAGAIHGGVGPTNILVARDGEKIQAMLTDPGRYLLMGEKRLPGRVSQAAYMAPEEAPWSPLPLDHRTDLYRLGLVAYRILAGRLPFGGNTPQQMAHHHLATQPSSPRNLNGHIPQRLAAVVLKLLAKEKQRRYQSAAGLLADLAHWDQPGTQGLGRADQPPAYPLDPPPVGREAARTAILAALRKAAAGSGGGLVLLSGEPGMGKRSAFIHLLPQLESAGALTLSCEIPPAGWCPPLLLPRRLAAQAAQRWQEMAEQPKRDLQYRLLDGLGANSGLLCALAPELRPLLSPDGASMEPLAPVPPERERRRAIALAVRLFQELAEPGHPLVLWLGGLHGIDPDSLAWLRFLLQKLPESPLVVVASVSPGRTAPDAPLTHWLERASRQNWVNWVECPPLTPPQVEQFLTGRLTPEEEGRAAHPLVKPLAQWMRGKWNGHPLAQETALRILLETATLARSPGGEGETAWRLDWEGAEALGLSANLGELMRQRLALLPKDLVQMAEALALQPEPLSFRALSAALNKPQPALLVEQLEEAMALGLVERQPDGYTLTHARLREELHQGIAPARRATLHKRLAAFFAPLLDHGPQAPLDALHYLALHAQAGGEPEMAHHAGWNLALACGQVQALEAALRWVRACLAGGQGESRQKNGLLRQAAWLVYLNRMEEALEALTALERLAPPSGPEEEITRLRLAALAYDGRGRAPQALLALEGALAAGGQALPETPVKAALAQLAAGVGRSYQAWLPSRKEKTPVALEAEEAAAAQALETAALLLASHQPQKSVLADEKLLQLTHGKELSGLSIRALIRLGEAQGRVDSGQLELAGALLEQANLPFEQAELFAAVGRIQLNSLQLAPAKAALSQALRAFYQAGDPVGEAETTLALLEASRLEGDLAALAAQARSLSGLAEAMESEPLWGWATLYLTYGQALAGEKPPAAARALFRKVSQVLQEAGDPEGALTALLFSADISLLEGDIDQAGQELAAATPLKTGGYAGSLLECLKADAAFVRALADPAQTQPQLKQGLDHLKLALAAEQNHPRLMVETIRLEVAARLLKEEEATALKTLEEGLALLQEQGARLALARLYFAVAELLRFLNREDYAEWGGKALNLSVAVKAGLLARAVRHLLRQDETAPPLDELAEPLEGLLGEPHPLEPQTLPGSLLGLLEALDQQGPRGALAFPEGVLRALMESAGGERGVLFLPNEDGALVAAAQIPPDLPGGPWIHRGLVESVWQEREGKLANHHLTAEDPQAGQNWESQSVICVPLNSRNGPVGVAYLSSGMERLVFTQDALARVKGLALQCGAIFAVKRALLGQQEKLAGLRQDFSHWQQWVEWSLYVGNRQGEAQGGVDSVLTDYLGHVAQPRGFEGAAVYWREDNSPHLKAGSCLLARRTPPALAKLPPLPMDSFHSRAMDAFRNQIPMKAIPPDHAPLTPEEQALLEALSVKGGLWLPLVSEGMTNGLLFLAQPEGREESSAESLEELTIPLRLLMPVLKKARAIDTMKAQGHQLVQTAALLESSRENYFKLLPASLRPLARQQTSGKAEPPLKEEAGAVLMAGHIEGLAQLLRQNRELANRSLAEYYTEVGRALSLHYGELEQLSQEGWLALMERGAESALWGGQTLYQLLAALNENRQNTLPPLRTGLALHSGPLVAQLVAAGNRSSPLVYGDGPQAAVQLARQCRALRTRLLVSQPVLDLLENPAQFDLRLMGRLTLKEGRPIPYYECFSLHPPEMVEAIRKGLPLWSQLMDALARKETQAAQKLLSGYLELAPKDPAALMLQRQLSHLAKNQP